MDPPIPVPDVAGADATVRGLPRRVDLTLRQRLIVDASAAADIGLRTAIASLLAATMLPTMLGGLRRGQSQAEQEQLRFYTRAGRRERSRVVLPGADLGAARVVATRQPGRRMDRQGQRAQHPVQQQLRVGQPGVA